ncbi:hypothetical protein BDN72DRAFT_759444 [Pluteus cervinus]|uniref:Uncharacterized protein n=1 Tax=Pluteus cervinus TaxID=181527 RepID=A0ACD3BA70_9AGAR|nr:hypothetical protein BDN72DRAFT_759444 [Pluteus cervinus]
MPSEPTTPSDQESTQLHQIQVPQLPDVDPLSRRKDGTVSKMRSHRGNVPVLPQTKLCPHCPAKFTRTTHLNRHLRTHTGERLHRCDLCDAQFTRSDLLARHKRSCVDPLSRLKRKACLGCVESKVKCDRETPCSRCASRGRQCVYPPMPKKPPSVIMGNESINSDKSLVSPSTSSSVVGPPTPPQDDDAPDETPTTEVFHPNSQRDDPRPSPFRNSAIELPTRIYDPKGKGKAVGAVNSHLSPAFWNDGDEFVKLFSNVFPEIVNPNAPAQAGFDATGSYATETSGPLSEAFGIPSFFTPSMAYPLHSFNGPSIQPALNDARYLSVPNLEEGYALYKDPTIAELQHYLQLYSTVYVEQHPISHVPSFNPGLASPYLLSAMQACGALFVKTTKASLFVAKTLYMARDALMEEFARNSTDPVDQMHLVVGTVLLQTIGLFHEQSDERTSASWIHGLLVMLIRNNVMIKTNAAWKPNFSSSVSLDALWRNWVTHESMKRAIIWSYMHDCCHSMYFGWQPQYLCDEMDLYLPCNSDLWEAKDANEWWCILHSPTQAGYADTEARLRGPNLRQALQCLKQHNFSGTPIALDPFAHFVLIHAILRRLFSICLEDRLANNQADDRHEQSVRMEIRDLDYSMQNWVESWKQSPLSPRARSDVEPPFIANVLPFYWLGQVALLAYQEGLPPFSYNASHTNQMELHYRLVKRWLRHIRNFLKNTDEASTLVWADLMKVRLHTWQQEVEVDLQNNESQDGVTEFFTEL